MDFLHIHSREDGDRLVLTHSYNLSHTCIGFGKLLTGFLWNLTFRNPLPMRAGTCELQPEFQEQIWRNSLFPKPMHHCCQLICHQSAMLYILIDVYLPNLATRTPYLELILTSELSYVYGCEASDPCTLGTPFPSVMAVDQFSSSCEASFWKLQSIEVNYTYWCKIRIDVGVILNLSSSLVTSLSPQDLTQGSTWAGWVCTRQSEGKLLTAHSRKDISF